MRGEAEPAPGDADPRAEREGKPRGPAKTAHRDRRQDGTAPPGPTVTAAAQTTPAPRRPLQQARPLPRQRVPDGSGAPEPRSPPGSSSEHGCACLPGAALFKLSTAGAACACAEPASASSSASASSAAARPRRPAGAAARPSQRLPPVSPRSLARVPAPSLVPAHSNSHKPAGRAVEILYSAGTHDRDAHYCHLTPYRSEETACKGRAFLWLPKGHLHPVQIC